MSDIDTRMRRRSRRGRQSTGKIYPDGPSLLAPLVAIYRWLKAKHGGQPSMRDVVRCTEATDENGKLVQLYISYGYLRQLREDYDIPWPPA